MYKKQFKNSFYSILEFQKQVLKLLVLINDKLARSQDFLTDDLSTDAEELEQLNTMADFNVFESSLKEKAVYGSLVSALKFL